METALAALAQESDTDLEETDVQEILLAYKDSRQLRGEQRVNRGFRPVTGRTRRGKTYRVEGRLNIRELISHVHVAASVVRRDTGHKNARAGENMCLGTVKRRRHHSLSTQEEIKARQVTLARG